MYVHVQLHVATLYVYDFSRVFIDDSSGLVEHVVLSGHVTCPRLLIGRSQT